MLANFGEKLLTVVPEFAFTDARDGQEFFIGRRKVPSHESQRVVAKDNVGRNTQAVGL